MPILLALAGAACRQRLPPSSLLCTGAGKDRRPTEQACGCSSVRGGCKLFACLIATWRSCLPTKAGAFLFALHCFRPSKISDQSRGRCKLCAFVANTCRSCVADKGGHFNQSSKLAAAHRYEVNVNCVPVWPTLAWRSCLPTKAARRLLLCVASKPSRISDHQSSKLAAALRCEADANCLPVCLALAGAACRQRLAPSSLLCTSAVQAFQPIEQACGCLSI